MARIVLTTIGSLGDLHPFIAIALALKARGHQPVLAVAEDHLAKVRAAGLEGTAVLPGFDTVRQRLGMPEDEAVKRVMADQRYMLEQVVLPWLSSSTDSLDAAVAGADALVASLFVFGAPIVAEKRAVPLVSVILQPMALLSAERPPHTPDFWMMRGTPKGSIGKQWNRLAFATLRGLMRQRYGRTIDEVRAHHGLGKATDPSMFDVSREAALVLCCYSPLFGPLQDDAPPNSAVVGFPIFDSASGEPAVLDDELEMFIAGGEPPLVFTLGSFAVHAPGEFYRLAAEAATRLGRRAILLTGGKSRLVSKGDILVRAYAPHSALFGRAAAIIHHGGIGTTGQALRAGKPQLVVPHMGDQADHAHRVKMMGVGRRLLARRFTAKRAAKRIASLLDPANPYTANAERIGTLIAAERGAEAAADAIEAVVRART
ncbi:MAG: glycosyltransferase [Sphingomonas sp.]